MRSRYLCAFLAVSALPACGDEDVDCSFEACGGDPVGAWTIDGACSPTQSGTDEDCPGSTLVQSVSYSGTWTFDADMTYAVDGQTLQSLQGSFPQSCLGQIPTCEDVGEQGIDCRTVGDRCECNSVSSAPYTVTGTWTSSGATLTLDGNPWTYCRTGQGMKMRSATLGQTFVLSQ